MAFFAVCVKSTGADETWARKVETMYYLIHSTSTGYGSSFYLCDTSETNIFNLSQAISILEICPVLKQVLNPVFQTTICKDIRKYQIHTFSQPMEINILVLCCVSQQWVLWCIHFSNPDEVTFRARLHGTAQASSSQLLNYIEQWNTRDVTITVQGLDCEWTAPVPLLFLHSVIQSVRLSGGSPCLTLTSQQ